MIKRHPLAFAVLSLVLISLPQWVSSVWSLFYSEPMVTVIERQPWGPTSMVYVRWAAGLSGALMLIAVGIQEVRRRGIQPPAEPPPAKESQLEKTIAETVVEQVEAQRRLEEIAPRIQTALQQRIGFLIVATKRQERLKAIKDLKGRSMEQQRAFSLDARDLDQWVQSTTPLIESFLESSVTIRDCYRRYEQWYRQKPQMRKSRQPIDREKVVANLRSSRATTDLVLNIREAALRPIGSSHQLDASIARYVTLLDRLIAACRATEEKSLEVLAALDGASSPSSLRSDASAER